MASPNFPLCRNFLFVVGSGISHNRFSDFGTQAFIDGTLEKHWEYLDKAFDEDLGKRPKSRCDLMRFVIGMKAKDRVIVPGQGMFSMYEIMEDAPQCISEIDVSGLRTWTGEDVYKSEDGHLRKGDNQLIDLGFARLVKPIEMNISRSTCADASHTARMKTRWTNADISDLDDSVLKAIHAHRNNKPINLHSTLLERNVKSTLDSIKSELSPMNFESLIQWYFKRLGATEVDIPAKSERDKEGDADIVATFETLKLIIYVQAKFHAGETGDWAQAQINDYKDLKESRLLVGKLNPDPLPNHYRRSPQSSGSPPGRA